MGRVYVSRRLQLFANRLWYRPRPFELIWWQHLFPSVGRRMPSHSLKTLQLVLVSTLNPSHCLVRITRFRGLISDSSVLPRIEPNKRLQSLLMSSRIKSQVMGPSFSSNSEAQCPVAKWLTSLGCSEYIHVFQLEGFERLSDVVEITEEDLDAMNVKRGHRRRMLHALREMLGPDGWVTSQAALAQPTLVSNGLVAVRPVSSLGQGEITDRNGLQNGNEIEQPHKRQKNTNAEAEAEQVREAVSPVSPVASPAQPADRPTTSPQAAIRPSPPSLPPPRPSDDYAMLCYAMLCYAMLCYAMLCYAMLCYAMLCYAMLC
eukprot:g66446.t1